ncbi:MAG: preprotein translocase subunit SecA [Pseudomonadota bacterium]
MVSLAAFASKLFGSSNERKLKKYYDQVETINGLEAELEALSDEALRARTKDFQQNFKDGRSLEDLLPAAFATVREGAKRTLGQRHYDVQLIGGMVLNDGTIAEMKTGEGKTLVGTLPVYLNALTGNGVHVVTVNDYLASRDAEWMGQIYKFLGLSIGCILPDMDHEERKAQYACDITYGTNNEFGFDYLRDNMEDSIETMVQREHYFAIVDEVDSILIDEARTPLIISGPAEDQTELYQALDKFIPDLTDEDFEIDEKTRAVTLTEIGNERIEQMLDEANMLKGDSLYDLENVSIVHHVTQALRAHKLFAKDRDYIVKKVKGPDGKPVNSVVIIDEFTGRTMEGRRYSEGLHQALEAKERVLIQRESQTLASTTFQNYFRLYKKLAGMTGTAATEAEEFMDIYSLDVAEIPTNLPVARIDYDDEIYRTADEKHDAIIDLIVACQDKKQPVLVGTTSIIKSELLSEKLKKKKVKHEVLNAKQHEREAYIVAQAGVPGAVTIATNMAGRGTDIQLGGNLDMRIADETKDIKDTAKKDKKIEAIKADIAAKKAQALEAGGLYVVASERHESRRIDNQLRGRSGRQGDPGASKFFLSLEDDLMRIFGSQRMDGMLQKLGLEKGEAIVHSWINKALEKAQQKVEARNFEIRKHVLKYDDVMNDQRKVIFEQRIEIMAEDNVKDLVSDMRHEVVENLVSAAIPEKAYAEQWDVESLQTSIEDIFGLDLPIADWAKEEGIAEAEILDRLRQETDTAAAKKATELTPELMRQAEKTILLFKLDDLWREHLVTLEHLREWIHLVGHAQVDPLNEYKSQSFSLFETMLSNLRVEVTKSLMRVHVALEEYERDPHQDMDIEAYHPDHYDDYAPNEMAMALDGEMNGVAHEQAEQRIEPLRSRTPNKNIDPADPSTWGKVGRNDTCLCGSGKKFKRCCGRLL